MVKRVNCMVFIAFFGIQDKNKHVGTYSNTVCPSCGRLTGYEIYKTYRYFHIFFIPVFWWNVRYIVKTSCCGSLFEPDPLVGKEFAKKTGIEIREENLRRADYYSPFKHCSNCNTDVAADFVFCPYFGGRL